MIFLKTFKTLVATLPFACMMFRESKHWNISITDILEFDLVIYVLASKSELFWDNQHHLEDYGKSVNL